MGGGGGWGGGGGRGKGSHDGGGGCLGLSNRQIWFIFTLTAWLGRQVRGIPSGVQRAGGVSARHLAPAGSFVLWVIWFCSSGDSQLVFVWFQGVSL